MLFAVVGRSVLGKTVPEVLSTARGRNNVFIFFFGTALKATFVLNFLLKKFSSNLAYARAFTKNKKCLFLPTLVIGIHNCLTVQKVYILHCLTLLRCYKKLETFLQLEI